MEYTVTIDGFKATFTDKAQIEAVEYLLEKLEEWKITATTYKNAINLIDELYRISQK